jgi:hypothetical protein
MTSLIVLPGIKPATDFTKVSAGREYYSKFIACSLIFSVFSFKRITVCATSALFILEPMVFASL